MQLHRTRMAILKFIQSFESVWVVLLHDSALGYCPTTGIHRPFKMAV